MLGPRVPRRWRSLVSATLLAFAAVPAGAQAVAPEDDHTPPVVTMTQDPDFPTFGQGNWFNSQDLAAPGSRVRISVSATDETVFLLNCGGTDDFVVSRSTRHVDPPTPRIPSLRFPAVHVHGKTRPRPGFRPVHP